MRIPSAKAESYLFLIVLTLFLSPVLLLTPFVTLDGPAHLYNARLLHDLITGPDLLTAGFYEINPVPEPNWTGHLIMSILLHVIPALWAEKILQCLILIGFALGYRKLMKTLEPTSSWMTWLIFPLLYNYTFLIGFYNFMVGLTLLPFFVSTFILKYEQERKPEQLLINGLLLTIIFFSHILIFLIAGFICGLLIQLHPRKELRKRKLHELLLMASPGILFTFNYFLTHGNAGYRNDIQWLPFTKILEDIAYSRAVIMYDYLKERKFTFFISLLLSGLLFTGIYYRTIQKYQKVAFSWLIAAVVILFVIPDSMASGGIITPRLELWLMLTLIIFLSVLRLPGSIAFPAGILAAAFGVFFGITRLKTQISLNKDALSILSLKNELHTPSQLLPVNQSDNWMQSNLVTYLGAVQPVLVLDNYEADHQIFPVRWKEGMKPMLHAGNHAATKYPCITIEKSEKHTGFKIDYLSFWRRDPATADTCSLTISDQLHSLFSAVQKSSGNFSIYTRK